MWLDQTLGSYLFLQPLAGPGEVLDLFPGAPAGPGHLAKAGARVRTVLPAKALEIAGYPSAVRADWAGLPFRRGSFGLVICTTLFTRVPAEQREALIKDIRSLVAMDGAVAVVLPNARRSSPFFTAEESWPDVTELETALRRQFP